LADPRPLRIVHTSDVHLGAYSSQAEQGFANRRVLIEAAFTAVIDLAVDVEAGLLVIAGDFFDNDRVGPDIVDYARRQLRRFPGPKLLLPGNHDPLDAGRLYDREDLEADVPGLRIVREHGGECMEIAELDLVAWGRGYFDHDWHFKPLEGIPERIDRRWHIALAHGHFVDASADQHRSLLIRESEVEAAGAHWDYLALGHWEPHADVSRGGLAAIYSGAPMPLSDSNRRAGWAIVADFDHDGVRWQPYAVDPRRLAGEW
jgi:DNA repair exonuclease SbcCD nuclease subunit